MVWVLISPHYHLRLGMPETPAQIYLGFDFGLKHIGVAIGQVITLSARPLTSLKAQNGRPNWHDIDRLLHDWQPHAIVVGEPLNMDGSPQALTHAARHFGKQLRKRSQCPVHFFDERLSTVESREHLFASGGYKALAKDNIDSFAAKLILESFLRSLSI